MLSLESHASRLASESRLSALRATGLLDDKINEVLDRVSRLATSILGVPIAAVSLITDEAQYFTGMAGIDGWAGERRGTPIAYSFCQHVVATERPFIVNDARDNPLVRNNPALVELNVVAYAGVPLTNSDGETLGAFCAIDKKAHNWTDAQVAVLQDLAAAAMSEIELRATVRALAKSRDELIAAQNRLRDQATRDELTGLLNRRGFGDHARQYLANAQRLATPFLVLNFDLDEFKSINDRLGHDAGDQALIEMAALLKQVFRTADVIARMGGDEFAVLVSNTASEGAPLVLSRFQTALDERNALPNREYRLRTSVGVSAFDPSTPLNLAQLIRKADVEMYEHKRAGKLAGAAA